MKPEVVIHGFETSNNMKVRVALGYKDIPYEFRAIRPGRAHRDLPAVAPVLPSSESVERRRGVH
jgi:glutathione S-transferase